MLNHELACHAGIELFAVLSILTLIFILPTNLAVRQPQFAHPAHQAVHASALHAKIPLPAARLSISLSERTMIIMHP